MSRFAIPLSLVLLLSACPRPPVADSASPGASRDRAAPDVTAAEPVASGPAATPPPAPAPEKKGSAPALVEAREEAAAGWDPETVWADGNRAGEGREQVDAEAPRKTRDHLAEKGAIRQATLSPPAKSVARAAPVAGTDAMVVSGNAGTGNRSQAGFGGGGRGIPTDTYANHGVGKMSGQAPLEPLPSVAVGWVPPPRPRMAVALRSDRIVRPLPPRPASWPRNARYRSNYLPGRGYLDGLAASLTRPAEGRGQAGLASAPEIGLLLPEHRTPRLPVPGNRAIDLSVDQLYPRVPPEGIQTTLRVRLRAAEGTPRPRPPLRLHLVIDGSGSMKGESWTQVCAAVRDVAMRIGSGDLLSIVVYDDTARTITPPVPGGQPALEAVAKVCAIRPRRETNIHAGLTEGYALARSVYTPGAVNRVILISDGMPTVGPTDPYTLTLGTTEALGAGITTSTVGIGAGFDALIMGRIASEGAGNFHFVRDRASVPAVFSDELRVLAEEAAAAVEVRVRLHPRVQLREVVGSAPLGVAEAMRSRSVEVATDQRLAAEAGIAADREHDFDAGVRFLIPSFRLGDEHAFVLELFVPGDLPPGRYASVELRYKDRIAGRNVYLHADPMAGPARDRAEAEAFANPDVGITAARARVADALQRASEYLDPINVGAIRNELYAAAQALSVAAGRAGDVVSQQDADRVRRMADRTGLAFGPPDYGLLATLYHYGWRTCGVTSWR